jgi:hypothetical protein
MGEERVRDGLVKLKRGREFGRSVGFSTLIVGGVAQGGAMDWITGGRSGEGLRGIRRGWGR